MKRRIFAIAFALAALGFAAPVDAATAYMLNYTQWNPYEKYAVAGPFDSLQECMSVKAQQSITSSGMYSCDSFSY
jgi:hypothetical protein